MESYKPRNTITKLVNHELDTLMAEAKVAEENELLQKAKEEKIASIIKIRAMKPPKSADPLKRKLRITSKQLSQMSENFRSVTDLANAKVQLQRKVSEERKAV